MKMKQVKLNKSTDDMLSEMSKLRKQKEHLNSTKQGIVAEAVQALHKKVIRK